MMMERMYCIECRPVLSQVKKEDFERVVRGIPMEGEFLEERQMLWVANVMTGLMDQRRPQYHKFRQRIAVWTDRKEAQRKASEMDRENTCWTNHVQEIRVINKEGSTSERT